MMKKFLILFLILSLITVFFLAGCNNKNAGKNGQDFNNSQAATDEFAESATQAAESIEDKQLIVMSITPEEGYRIISENMDYFLIDVRTEEEYMQGYIETANLIPLQELESRLDEIPKNKQIIIYCRSGNRSREAANILINNGFGMVYDMGGIIDWQQAGFPVVK
ncbi:MAG: rhodanese-like domain-containing protein [Actinobacteria bacterium]|nr:rhodanese-like domain-containing protein [Actinomycetota bacterium]